MRRIALAFALALSAATHAATQVALEGGAFLSAWPNFHNQWIALDAQTQHALTERTQLRAQILSRSDSPLPVLGNVNEFWYRVDDHWRLGRLAPEPESSIFSLDRFFNHRICQTPFTCATGGPIGAHYLRPTWRLSLELLHPPNLSPTPGIENGKLKTRYRWNDPPYQFVEVNDKTLPLMLSTDVDLRAARLFIPGLVFDGTWLETQSLKLRFVLASGPAKAPQVHAREGVLVIDDPQAGLVAVVNSDRRATFPWQTVLLSRNEWRTQAWRIGWDLGARLSEENAYETFVRITYGKNSPFTPQISLGAHRRGDDDFLSMGSAFTARFRALSTSVEAQWIFSERGGTSTMLSPRLGFDCTPALSLYAQARLLRVHGEEPIFAKLGAQDHIGGGLSYAF